MSAPQPYRVGFTVVTTEPVQQVAAEPLTLAALTASLRTRIAERTDEPAGHALGSLTGFPLVNGPDLPPGEVHLRPTPGAPPPATPEEIAAVLAMFTRVRPAP